MSTQQTAEKNIPFFALGGKIDGSNIKDDSIAESHVQYKVLTGTSDATAGTGVNVAHGLSATPKLYFVRQGNAYIDAVDGTNVTVKSTGTSQAFEVVVIY